MRALVTGGCGFIGSRLAAALIAEGYEVRCLDNLSEGRREALTDQADLIEADLRDREAVAAAAKGSDVIFHKGAVRSIPKSVADPEEANAVNLGGTLNVLLAARDENARVVFASSSSIYGDQGNGPQSESQPPAPRSPYAASKVGAEGYCRAFTGTWGVPTISLRYFNVYGPGQDPESEYAAVVPKFIAACLEGRRPVIHGDGMQRRDFTYIDDVMTANLRAAIASDAVQGECVNIGGGRTPTTIVGLLEEIARQTDAHPDPIWEPARAGDIRHSQADVAKARRLLGYAPQFDLRAGLERTIAWFRAGL